MVKFEAMKEREGFRCFLLSRSRIEISLARLKQFNQNHSKHPGSSEICFLFITCWQRHLLY